MHRLLDTSTEISMHPVKELHYFEVQESVLLRSTDEVIDNTQCTLVHSSGALGNALSMRADREEGDRCCSTACTSATEDARSPWLQKK